MKTSLATCPQTLSISLPLFSDDSITYVPYDPKSDDTTTLRLHHESLTVPPRVVINRTVINEFDEMFKYYDSQLSSAKQKADYMVDQIEVTSETTLTEYVAYVALGLSTFNFILCCQCLARLSQRRLEAAFKEKIPPQAVVAVPPRPHKICKRR